MRAFHQHSRSTLNNEDLHELVDVSEFIDLSGSHSWGNQNLCDSIRALVAAFSPLPVMWIQSRNMVGGQRGSVRFGAKKSAATDSRALPSVESSIASQSLWLDCSRCSHRFSTCCGELVLRNFIPPSNALRLSSAAGRRLQHWRPLRTSAKSFIIWWRCCLLFRSGLTKTAWPPLAR